MNDITNTNTNVNTHSDTRTSTDTNNNMDTDPSLTCQLLFITANTKNHTDEDNTKNHTDPRLKNTYPRLTKPFLD